MFIFVCGAVKVMRGGFKPPYVNGPDLLGFGIEKIAGKGRDRIDSLIECSTPADILRSQLSLLRVSTQKLG